MIVEIDLNAPSNAALVGADDFATFKVVLRNGDSAAARPQFYGLVQWLDDDVAVAFDAVRRLAVRAGVGPEWEQRFSEMIEGAASHGWVVGEAIRAHVVWATARS